MTRACPTMTETTVDPTDDAMVEPVESVYRASPVPSVGVIAASCRTRREDSRDTRPGSDTKSRHRPLGWGPARHG